MGPSTSRETQAGSALMLALVAATIVAMAVLLTAGFLQTRTDAFGHQARGVELTALADAALAEALANLAKNKSFKGAARHPFGSGEIGSSVSPAGKDMVQIRAVGAYEQGRISIVADVKLNPSGPRVIRWRYRQGSN